MQSFVLRHTGSPQVLDYEFSGGRKVVQWPQEDGVQLGMAGAWNFLFRLGASPSTVDESSLPVPREGDVLYVTADVKFVEKTEKALQDWMAAGGRIVASGCPEAWRFVFPKNVILESARLVNCYAGLAWLRDGLEPELIAPPNWTYLSMRFEMMGEWKCIGRLAAVSGERQTPKRALVEPIQNAPAMLFRRNFFYLNASPFAALQSWLQGQEDLQPWLAWRHRIFWLDEYTAFLHRVLQEYHLLPVQAEGIPGLAQTTIVFRHDLDYSRDTTYLELENQAGLSGVHAILKDRNTKFWVNLLKTKPRQESAFHFNTGHYSRLLEEVRHKLLNLPKRQVRPNRKAIKGNGLLSQVRWAKRNGIGIETLHRHICFMFYPELVDALDIVYENEPEVVGGSSFFRGAILRWGINDIDGRRGSVADFTDPQFPFWFPFRLAHAGAGGRMLKGWESTCMMEAEPRLVEQMIDHHISGLPQKVMVLNYHPAHANNQTFAKNGCVGWFREILDMCKHRGVEVRPLAEVYRIINASL